MGDFEVRLSCSCEEAARLTIDILTPHGFKVVRTFDLRDAMHVQGTPYRCPYHGPEAYACNYIVLSVEQAAASGQSGSPLKIVVKSYQGHTRFSLLALADSVVESQKGIQNPRLLRGLAEVLHAAAFPG